jgi:hypothetical protein
MSDRYLMGQGLVDKLRQTVNAVDSMVAHDNPAAVRVTFDEPATLPSIFRIATFGTAAWAIDTTATVTLLNVGVTGYTVAVSNVFGSVATAASSRQVAIARDGTAWYLIQARCP